MLDICVLLRDMFKNSVLILPDVEKVVAQGTAFRRDHVELAGPVFGEVPLRRDPAVLLESAEQGIERVLLDFVAQPLDMLDHGIAVHLFFEESQDEDLQESPVHLRFEAAYFRICHVFSFEEL